MPDSELDTRKHIARVRELLMYFVQQLMSRAIQHDETKLQEPEKPHFDKVGKLDDVTYGSEEYEQLIEKLDEALTHHYAHNRHHPEHFENGIDGMTLVDLVEMFLDWKAASERHDDGNIMASIENSRDRFRISPQLQRILQNTAKEYFPYDYTQYQSGSDK